MGTNKCSLTGNASVAGDCSVQKLSENEEENALYRLKEARERCKR